MTSLTTTTCAHTWAAAVSDTRAWLSRRLTIALAALALLGGGIVAPSARAQQGNVVLRQFSGVPFGACSNVQISVNVLTGDLYDCLNGVWNLITGGLGGPLLFSAIQTGTNLTATMTVGTGATLTFSGTGINNASKIQNVAITGTPTIGQIPIASSGTAAAWGDPLVTPNFADNSAFTAGTTGVMNIGAWYSASPTACTTGNACAPSLTIDRKLFTQAFQGTSPWVVSLASTTITGTAAVTQSTSPWVVSASGTFGVTQSTSPWVVSLTSTTLTGTSAMNLTQVAGSTLGSSAIVNYGSTPAASLVPGVNAFITNTPAVTLTSTTITGTVAVTQSTSPWVDNITQFGGTILSTGTGASGAGIPRVTISNDSSLAANQSVNVAQIAGATTSTAASGVQKVGIVGNAGAAFDAADAAAPPANVIAVGGLVSGATGGLMGKIPICDTYKAINISTITTTLLITGVSGRHVRICEIHIITAATADNIAFVSGTGATCATGTTGMSGGATAAAGWVLPVSSKIDLGNGLGTVMKTTATGDSVCAITSATVQVSGGISYAIY